MHWSPSPIFFFTGHEMKHHDSAENHHKQKFVKLNKNPTHRSAEDAQWQCSSEETTVPQNLLLGRRVSSSAWGASLLQQRHGKRARRAARHDRTPPSKPRRLRTSFHQCGCGRCLRLRERPQELGRLIRPSPAHLTRKNHQTRTTTFPRQLGESAFFPLARRRQRDPIPRTLPTMEEGEAWER